MIVMRILIINYALLYNKGILLLYNNTYLEGNASFFYIYEFKMKDYNNEKLNEILGLSITLNNSITFSCLNFNLSTLYNKLYDFHISYQLENKLFFAYPFNEDGLLTKKHPISGYIDSHRPLSMLTSGLLTNEDLEFFFNLEYKLGDEYAYLYKYNVLNLYIMLKIALQSDVVMEDDLLELDLGKNSSIFHIFISKEEVYISNLKFMVDNFFKNL